MSTRKVILGVCGGIAAYKSCELLRRLQDRGVSATVIPTENSLRFVGAATWEALTGKRVQSSLWDDVPSGAHIELARDAEFMVIAPATADCLARLAQGRADDLLSATVLTATCPVAIIPAMHHQMWTNPATRANVEILRIRGFLIMDPVVGPLNNGDVGVGRFPETFEIFDFLAENGLLKSDLLGKKVVVTAGGTREMIDPVRFIGNLSSGKQGIALANAAASRGAHVKIIAANVSPELLPNDPLISITKVSSTADLAVQLNKVEGFDLLFMAAAVADYRPADISTEKIKRNGSGRSLALEENPDLLATFTAQHRATGASGIIVGFAAESEVDVETAMSKMTRKGVDFLFVNDVVKNEVFGSDFNGGLLLSPSGELANLPYQEKDTLAHALLDVLGERLG